MSISDLQRQLRDFAQDRDWEQFHDPKNLVMALTSEVGELAELFQWLTPEQATTICNDANQRQRVGEELADVFGYVIRLADVLQVDLEESLNSKIRLNAAKYPIDRSRGSARKYTELDKE